VSSLGTEQRFRVNQIKQEAGELAAFSALLRGKKHNWSQKARALKYDLEYKPAEQERRRVAAELHDQVLPLLARLSRGAKSENLAEAIHQIIEKIRSLLGELHPVDLEELGLSAAIANLSARYSRLYKRRITFQEGDDDLCLSEVQKLAAYRALQTLLKMFALNGSGTLKVTSAQGVGEYKVMLLLRDCRHSAARSLISDLDEQELEELAGWCTISQMEVQLHAGRTPHSVVLSIPEPVRQKNNGENLQTSASAVDDQSQARLLELETVVKAAQQEWAHMLSRDAAVTGNMSVSVERQRLCRIVEELIHPHLAQIYELARQSDADHGLLHSIEEIKAVLNGVVTAAYPIELQTLSLVELVGLAVERFKRATLISTKIVAGKIENLSDLALEKKIAVFRIVQEALHNVEKHSQASTLLVLLEPTRDTFVICVEDNGLGMSDNNNNDNGDNRGIRGVRERAQEIGATVSWQKSISYESGTLVTIKIPRS